MVYERVNWQDTPNTNTPINAENLNKMDAGIKAVHDKANSLARVAYFTMSGTKVFRGRLDEVSFNTTEQLVTDANEIKEAFDMGVVRFYEIGIVGTVVGYCNSDGNMVMNIVGGRDNNQTVALVRWTNLAYTA